MIRGVPTILLIAFVACDRAALGPTLCEAQPDACGLTRILGIPVFACVVAEGAPSLEVRVEVEGWTGGGSMLHLWDLAGAEDAALEGPYHELHALCTTEVLDEPWRESLVAVLALAEAPLPEPADCDTQCPSAPPSATEVAPSSWFTSFCPDLQDDWRERLTVGVVLTESNGDYGRGASCVAQGAESSEVQDRVEGGGACDYQGCSWQVH